MPSGNVALAILCRSTFPGPEHIEETKCEYPHVLAYARDLVIIMLMTGSDYCQSRSQCYIYHFYAPRSPIVSGCRQSVCTLRGGTPPSSRTSSPADAIPSANPGMSSLSPSPPLAFRTEAKVTSCATTDSLEPPANRRPLLSKLGRNPWYLVLPDVLRANAPSPSSASLLPDHLRPPRPECIFYDPSLP